MFTVLNASMRYVLQAAGGSPKELDPDAQAAKFEAEMSGAGDVGDWIGMDGRIASVTSPKKHQVWGRQ